MALIPGSINKMNDIEISDDSPISVATLGKIAANMNSLIDAVQGLNLVEFNSSTNWTCPTQVTKLILVGCGGGGSGGYDTNTNLAYYGNGAPLSLRTVNVIPGNIYSVSIGGSDAPTTFGNLASLPQGSGGNRVNTTGGSVAGPFGVSGANTGGAGISTPQFGGYTGSSGKLYIIYSPSAV